MTKKSKNFTQAFENTRDGSLLISYDRGEIASIGDMEACHDAGRVCQIGDMRVLYDGDRIIQIGNDSVFYCGGQIVQIGDMYVSHDKGQIHEISRPDSNNINNNDNNIQADDDYRSSNRNNKPNSNYLEMKEKNKNKNNKVYLNKLKEQYDAIDSYLNKELGRLSKESDKHNALTKIQKKLAKKKYNEYINDELQQLVKEIREIVKNHQDDPFSITGLLHFNLFRNPRSLNNLNEKFKHDGKLLSSKFLYEYLP